METGKTSNLRKVTLPMVIAAWLAVIGFVAGLHILSVCLEREIKTAGLAKPPVVATMMPTTPNYGAQKLTIKVATKLSAVSDIHGAYR